jgi:phage tail-like protein
MLKWFGTKPGMRTLIVILAVALAISIVTQLIGANVGGLLTGTAVGVGREDPLVAFKFGLEVEGKFSGFFTSVSGIGSENEVLYEKIENPQTGETIIRAHAGRLSWTPITLERGITTSTEIWDWRQQVVVGDVDGARVDCSIVAYDQSNQEIARWNLVDAWPSSMIGPVMEEGGTSYMIEQVILVHEGMTRVH